MPTVAVMKRVCERHCRPAGGLSPVRPSNLSIVDVMSLSRAMERSFEDPMLALPPILLAVRKRQLRLRTPYTYVFLYGPNCVKSNHNTIPVCCRTTLLEIRMIRRSKSDTVTSVQASNVSSFSSPSARSEELQTCSKLQVAASRLSCVPSNLDLNLSLPRWNEESHCCHVYGGAFAANIIWDRMM